MKQYRCPICRRKLYIDRMKGFCVGIQEGVIYEVHLRCKKCKINTVVRMRANPSKTVGKDEEIFNMLIKRAKRSMREDYPYQ